MSIPTLEERVAALEAELAQLRTQQMGEAAVKEVPWWKKIVGVFQDDPAFEEAVRLGREWREAQRSQDEETGH